MTQTFPQINRRNASSSNNEANGTLNNAAQRASGGGGDAGLGSEELPRPESANSTLSNAESLMDSLLDAIQKFWIQVRRIITFIMIELGGYELFDAIVLWCVRNPTWAICLFAGGIVFLMPFLIIFGFGIATMIMTFTGILVLEGTLLTIVSMLFFGCLSCLAVVVVLLAAIALATYFGFAHLYDFYGGMERHRLTLLNYVQNQREQMSSSISSRPPSAASTTRRVVTQPRE